MQIWTTFLFLLLHLLYAIAAPSNSTNKDDEAIARTLAKIYGGADKRLIGLFCSSRCLKQRELVTKWIRTFNNEFHVSLNERADFHFHSYKKPMGLNAIDSVMNHSSVSVFYFVADQGFQYQDDLNSEYQFKEWLKRYENAPIRQIYEHEGLNFLLNEALTNCDENSLRYLVMVQDLVKCTDVLLPNIARSFIQDPTINVIELRRPLSLETEASLYWRLPGLSYSCRMIIFLHKGSYYEVEKNTLPSKLYIMLKDWDGGECNMTSVNNIRPELTNLQLEYVAEELYIRKIQDNQTYIAVGSIGGLAVIALAISIFWGLQSA